MRRSFSFEYILLIPFNTFWRNVSVLRNMTNCLVLRFLIVCSDTGNSHFSGYSFSYTDISLLCTIIITNCSCLTLKRTNSLASVKFPSWIVFLYLAHLGYLDWRSKGGGVENQKNEPHCAPLTQFLFSCTLSWIQILLFVLPPPLLFPCKSTEWRNIFFVEQETISRFKGGQSGKPMGTIVISEKKPDPPVVITLFCAKIRVKYLDLMGVELSVEGLLIWSLLPPWSCHLDYELLRTRASVLLSYIKAKH